MSFHYRSDLWNLVQSACLPSSLNNVGCSPFQFHESSIYSPVNSLVWTRVTLQLPDHVSSGYGILRKLLFLCDKHSICICKTVCGKKTIECCDWILKNSRKTNRHYTHGVLQFWFKLSFNNNILWHTLFTKVLKNILNSLTVCKIMFNKEPVKQMVNGVNLP